jgi:hypothetical protein
LETGLVQNRAARGEPSAIRLGPIVFFSTTSGDAWMIDVIDGEAACLARAGTAQPTPIEESASGISVTWQARHRLADETFVAIEDDGTEREHRDYPVAQIRRLIDEYPIEFSGVRPVNIVAARDRSWLTGRNDPCPCGSGRKYKKCCLPADELAAVGGSQSVQRAELIAGSSSDDPENSGEPVQGLLAGFEDEDEASSAAGAGEVKSDTVGPVLSPDVLAALDRTWGELNLIERPTPAQLDTFLDRLLELPPEASDWSEVFDTLAANGHPDLPAAFRRIAAVLPPTKAAGASFLYWNAMEKFVLHGRVDLVPEVASGFRRLDRASYDADALKHMVFWAMAAGCDSDALAMEEHFLPVMRGDPNLMPYAVPSSCRCIFELRVGLQLPGLGTEGGDVDSLTRELHRDLAGVIHPDFARRAAQAICGKARSGEFRREDLAMTRETVREGEQSWEVELRKCETMMHVAHEAWRFDGRPPGSAFHGLWLIVEAFYEERADGRT